MKLKFAFWDRLLNALVNACNQKSNREPVMMLEEDAVRDALHSRNTKCATTVRVRLPA
jgi:uncharacterized protein YceH (UPF0502 family)